MDPDQLAGRYPEVYHMAELGTWPSIQEHGLLSTSALLDLFEVRNPERFRLESQRRPQSVTINHPVHGEAVIRDQNPLPENELNALLEGMEPQEWYELINGKVFFWADMYGLKKLLCAYWYRDRAHCVLTVNTGALLSRHMEEIWLTDQNTGSTISKKLRGRHTFRRVEEHNTPWVTELAVDYGVNDIVDLTTRVEEWKADTRFRQIWPRQVDL